MQTSSFQLERTAFGLLKLTVGGEVLEGVTPVRAFPLQTPEHNIALVSTDGREVAWIADVQDVSPQIRDLILTELAGREFIPAIEQIMGVSSYSTPCTWTVMTDRGQTNFVLRGEEDIRRIGAADALLITDTHGINYVIRQPAVLDKRSKHIVDRFL